MMPSNRIHQTFGKLPLGGQMSADFGMIGGQFIFCLIHTILYFLQQLSEDSLRDSRAKLLPVTATANECLQKSFMSKPSKASTDEKDFMTESETTEFLTAL